ncbi:SIR2 family protein, partial [Bradyrhizobium sp. NBAIM08]|uniref:SIR2 family protein n=1 Tax=Bradyrhizobium sp. NBAIM08 TaxID=2793815 RepID=UPI001CD4C35B
EAQVVIKTLIGQILTERTPSLEQVPELYIEFAKRLQPNDLILTFNYDILLERALQRAGKRFRLFPYRFEHVGEYAATIDTTQEEIVVLKVHGSVDWFDRNPTTSRHPFFDDAALQTEPLVHGPRFAHDPLKEIRRVREIEKLY